MFFGRRPTRENQTTGPKPPDASGETQKVQTQPPQLDGLPTWAQVLISILFGVTTLAVSLKGYLGKKGDAAASSTNGQTTTAVLSAASIADMGAIRHLADVVVTLNSNVVALTTALNEGTHYSRNEVDIMREMCQRLRELAEEMERQGRDARRWDKRDEDRRP